MMQVLKGMGSVGAGDQREPYWSALCRLAGIDGLLGDPLTRPNPLLDGPVGLAEDVAAWLRLRVPLQV